MCDDVLLLTTSHLTQENIVRLNTICHTWLYLLVTLTALLLACYVLIQYMCQRTVECRGS